MQTNRNGQAGPTTAQSNTLAGSSENVGYGLPCANCRKYYAADLPACPTCQSTQRVPATNETLVPLTQNAGELCSSGATATDNPIIASPSTSERGIIQRCKNQGKLAKPHNSA